jgi:hypothetical protein
VCNYNPLPTFRDNVTVPSSRANLTLEDGTDTLSRNVGLTLEDGPTRSPETSVKDYHSALRNTPEERRSHHHRGGSLRSRILSRKSHLHARNFERASIAKDAASVFVIILTFLFPIRNLHFGTPSYNRSHSCLGRCATSVFAARRQTEEESLEFHQVFAWLVADSGTGIARRFYTD